MADNKSNDVKPKSFEPKDLNPDATPLVAHNANGFFRTAIAKVGQLLKDEYQRINPVFVTDDISDESVQSADHDNTKDFKI